MTHAPATSAAAIPITVCRGCGSRRLTRVLDLGEQPACDHFPPVDDPAPDPRWPLALTMCADCALVQLDHVSPAPEEPLAVESATLKNHARDASRTVLSRLGLPPGSTVREFASHHGGSWVAELTAAGCVVLDGATAHGGTAGDGRADLVVDNQSIIHAEDLEAQLAQRVAALADDGVLVIEFHHALQQLVQGQFDTARHGHPLSFSLTSWANACRRHGLEVVDAWPEDVFGGCLIVAARRAGRGSVHCDVADILAREREAGVTNPERYTELDRLRRRTSADFVAHLERARSAGRRVVAYGAGSKACTLLGVTGVGADLLPMVADLSPAKHGRRVPGVGIPIVSPEELVAVAPDEVMILTWDIAAEVIAQLRAMGLTGARFFVPLPRLAELTPA
ncbi:MAG: class I SAM-dependent methyltransferase [Dermatophilaceae bacterium]